MKSENEKCNRSGGRKAVLICYNRKSQLTLSPLDGPYSPTTNTGKDNFSGGKVQNIVNVLMAVFYNSLCILLIHLTMVPPEKCRFICVLTVK